MRARGGMANGVFGCAVVGIVILASLGLAFLGNADERQVDTTDWSYVTSANPAFTYGQAPARVDYSPPANYTGYTTSSERSEYISGVTYTAASTPTAYLAKIEPVLITSGDISFSGLISNGLTYIGNQPEDYRQANFRVGGYATHYTPAAATTLSNLSAALQAATSSTFDNQSIITLTPASINMFFTQANEDGGGAWIGAPIAQMYEYEVSGVLCDRAEIDVKSQIAKLYDDTTLKYTISAANALLVVADVDNTITTTAGLKALTAAYTVYSYDSKYINPNDGVTISTTINELSSFSDAAHGSFDQDTTVYNSVNFDGIDILNYSFRIGGDRPVSMRAYMTVEQGTVLNITYGRHEWTPGLDGAVIEPYTVTLDTLGEHTIIRNIVDGETLGDLELFNVYLFVRVVEPTPTPTTVNWFNGYDNAAVDLLVKSFEGSVEISGVTVACASSSWAVGGVAVGTWPAVLITFDMDAGVSVRPVSSMINFMSYELVNDSVQITTATSSPITSLSFSRVAAVNLAVVSTIVYLEGGGVYRVDSYLDVSAKFPNYTTYNVTINGAPHWGDSITINGTACAVDKAAGTVEISGATFPLSGLVLAYSDSTFYYKGNVYEAGHLVAINDGLAVDLGAAAGLVLRFDGTWYYETALYSGAPGTVTVIDWTPGVLGLDASAFAAVFTLLALVGLVLASRLGGGTWDYLVLGSAVLVGFIMCGVFI